MSEEFIRGLKYPCIFSECMIVRNEDLCRSLSKRFPHISNFLTMTGRETRLLGIFASPEHEGEIHIARGILPDIPKPTVSIPLFGDRTNSIVKSYTHAVTTFTIREDSSVSCVHRYYDESDMLCGSYPSSDAEPFAYSILTADQIGHLYGLVIWMGEEYQPDASLS